MAPVYAALGFATVSEEQVMKDEPLEVLVVDDDAGSLALTARLIQDAGYEVLTASDGAEAMQVLLVHGTPLIVTDWNMPEMDGLALCRAIRSHEGIGFTFIIVVTAHSDNDRIVEALEAGADDYVPKPFNRRELVARLRAGARTIKLQQDLDRRSREVFRSNAEKAVANTKLSEAYEKLKRVAITDELTGLANRREAMVRLAEHTAAARRHDTPLSCIMLDIDRFKNFNDTYGHAIGDLVLKEIANVLRSTARREERVCRVGGEEFLIVCPGTPEDEAIIGAERLRRAVEAHEVIAGDKTLKVTISLGVAQWAPAMSSHDDLLKAADVALYAAKEAGRNRVLAASTLDSSPTIADATDSKHSPGTQVPLADGVGEDRPVILIVDDDPSIRNLCTHILSRAGYATEHAVDGLDALVQVDRRRPDVIIMDALMPNLDGLECTRRLKGDGATSGIPIIMASAQTQEEDIIAGLEAGADEYINKPIRPREFALRVRSMVTLHRSNRELVQSNAVRGEQARVMGLLFEFSRAVAATETLEEILDRAVDVAAELTGCRRISIMLADATGRSLYVAKALGIEEQIISRIRVPVGAATAGKVFESGKPVVINSSVDAVLHKDRYDSDCFVSIPLVCSALSVSEQVVGVLNVTERQGGQPFGPSELESIDLICNITASAIHDHQARTARDQARDSIVLAMAKLAECRDNDTGKHVERVSRFCVILAKELRSVDRWKAVITDAFISDLMRAAPLHDIGKVAVPDYILNKPGRLTDEEIRIMRTHATIGANTIRSVVERVPEASFLKMAEEIAQSHHEWYDGNGYPQQISGKRIPIAARLTAVADVYDAWSRY